MGSTIVVVGGGITGLTAAYTVASRQPSTKVILLESQNRLGGNIKTSAFAGLPHVDEGADAFLIRVPWALDLCNELGFTPSTMTAPASGSAYVWRKKLHPIPGGLMLGVPGEILPIAKSGLLSPRGKLRAGLEPFLPRTDAEDSIGRLIRSRFGSEVHERLVDPLIGSIYASDTDRISINAVPQLAALNKGQRSLLLAVRKQQKLAKNQPNSSGIFATPLAGVGSIIDELQKKCLSLGVDIHSNAQVKEIEPGLKIHTSTTKFDANSVIVTSPAAQSAEMFSSISPAVADTLAAIEHVGVVMVTLRIPANEFPAKLTGSGYLVPKREQQKVTAVSFASNKWSHLNPSDGSKILRVSIGQDGNPAGDLNDDEILLCVLADLHRHLNISFTPLEVRISRWATAFPQYRPGHFERVDAVEQILQDVAPGVFLAGASHRGIGIPACVQQARAASEKAIEFCRGRG